MSVYLCGPRVVPGRLVLQRWKPGVWSIYERPLPEMPGSRTRVTKSGAATGRDESTDRIADHLSGKAPRTVRPGVVGETATVTRDEYETAKKFPIVEWSWDQWHRPLRANRFRPPDEDLLDDYDHDQEGSIAGVVQDEKPEPIIQKFSSPDQLEVCRYCGEPLPLPEGECEFTSFVIAGCECSGCSGRRKRGGQAKHCRKPECRRKMDAARQRRKYRRDRGIRLKSCNEGHTRVAPKILTLNPK